MRVLRLIVAGLVAVFAVVAGLFAAALVVVTGLVAWVLQLFRRRPAPASAASAPSDGVPTAPKAYVRRSEDVIDVVATKVPDEPPAG